MKKKKNKQSIPHEVITKYGIKFKSKLEVDCYEALKLSKFADLFKYEEEEIEAIPATTIKLISFEPKPKNKNKVKEVGEPTMRVINGQKLQSIKYTPDFVIKFSDYCIIVETKGLANEAWPIRKKLFKLKLNLDTDKQWIYCEPHNKTQIKETIEFLNQLK